MIATEKREKDSSLIKGGENKIRASLLRLDRRMDARDRETNDSHSKKRRRRKKSMHEEFLLAAHICT